ncbi:MAG: aminotransferase class V-fold PLP-dependent enzyme [Bryobacterales bacterium]|nr:aminotransferase class V-fold PLP-dependent enzyme [Bryobacterales bacterium]
MNRWFSSLSRRDTFRRAGTGVLGILAGRLPFRAAQPAAAGNLYQAIGVRPLINCRGTFTIISGSLTLPEVKKAMDEASRHYVHLDELADGVGRRLAQITQAEWGIVTAGCAAALTHATSACIAGADPEKMNRLPDLTGLKNEVVMPSQSRNQYDHAIRMLGVKMLTPRTREEFLEALSPATAVVSLLGESLSRHPMTLEEMVAAAHARNIPVLVDAAAERLTIPNVYLTKGVDMVGYSGGKCLRGPQCAGLLLGRKDLLQAAWINSSPHHAFGRPMKVGKEETMGMLAAVEAWVKRDHQAEWKEWESWLETIRQSVASFPTVRSEIMQPRGPSNYTPTLRVSWNASKVGLTGGQLVAALDAGDPRITLTGSDGFGPQSETSFSVNPYMMMPGEDAIVARRIREVFSNPPKAAPAEDSAASVQVSGRWDADLEFDRGRARHTLYLEQTGERLAGTHHGEFLSADLRGTVNGARVRFRSSHRHEGNSIPYGFDGTFANGVLTGTVDLGEYGTARFTAKKHFG